MPLQDKKGIRAKVRRSRVLQFKMGGKTNVEIAEIERVSRQQVFKDVRRRLGELAKEDNEAGADEFRALMMARYERLLLSYWARALDGEDSALKNVLQILRAEREVQGIDREVRITREGDTYYNLTVERLLQIATERVDGHPPLEGTDREG